MLMLYMYEDDPSSSLPPIEPPIIVGPNDKRGRASYAAQT